ncbi:MAG: AarF/ABC1/UbiB kinase family protein [Hydrogenobacter thermophilus]|uniref:ABC1 kinase family protein n=1 Tax=Hydrogenobacter thermophilus TaxID=940 RepID=UPI001C78E794|nr:AarF/ABC1/UbiB kinase family protein [Hydrogenobacter thermophilus]QWK20038.1 MAG: AarF/ABC1/UbiB kinase family protein [Hydrogenobacter thermophilus]
MSFKRVGRKAYIVKVLAKHGFGLFLFRIGLGHLVPFHWGILGHRRRKDAYKPEEHLRLAFEELGATFIKLGQILSVRPDLLPDAYIKELSKLQDKVPAVDTESIKNVVEEELKSPCEEIFDYFEDEPLASASIGQVHRARLKSGEEVILKVQKPGIERQIEEDLAIFEEFASNMMTTEFGRRWDIRSILEEFSYTIRNELDYIREGRNCDTFRRNFSKDTEVYIPKVYWKYTTKRVLCLERIDGIKINEKETLRAKGFNLREIAHKGADIYLKMIFRDGFFHADPHPGNFLVMQDGRIGVLDYGMVGAIDNISRINLFQLVYGIVKDDLELMMDALYDLGILIRPGQERFLKKELEILLSYYLMQPLKERKLSSIIHDTLRLSYKYGMRIPSDLFLILKTLALAEGVCSQLDPDFRLIEKLSPYVKKGFRQVITPMLSKDEVVRNSLIVTKMLLQGVSKTKSFLRQLERGEFSLSIEYKGEERFIKDLRRDINRLSMSIITLGFMLSSSLIILALFPHVLKDYVVYFLVFLTTLLVIFGFLKLRQT